MPGKNILEVKLFGDFAVSYAGNAVVIDRNAVSKTTQLLQLFLTHVDEGISKASLIGALYGRCDVENKNASLNNTLFRLRRQLKAVGIPDSNYINIQGGMCTWDKAIPVKVDACEFERLILKGQKEDEEKRIKSYKKALSYYTGEFLPQLIGEEWAAVENVRFRDLYFSCMKELCSLLNAREKYEEVYKYSSMASGIYPFEDWQIWQIDSLMAMSRYHEALEIYNESTKKAFDELGVSPSPEMLKRLRVMAEHVTQTAEVTENIRERLMEKDKEDGAYYCTFPSFVDIYHVFSRMMERSGISVCIMLCTLKRGKAKAFDEDERNRQASEILASAIQRSLRKGDFYTRYSYTQYLIMFSEISQENCKRVSDRILKTFRREAKKDYSIDFNVTSIADICKEEISERFFDDKETTWKRSRKQKR